jgi:hypothetical protein
MSFPEPQHLRRQRHKNTHHIKLDEIPMNSLVAILTTSKGWIIRQAIKATAYITTPLTAWLAANGADGDQTQAIVSGVVAAVAVLVELGLSFMARKNP